MTGVEYDHDHSTFLKHNVSSLPLELPGDMSERLQTAFTLPSHPSTSSLADQWLCMTHIAELKKVEAFCKDCRSPLCMGCILTNKHTSHEIMSLTEASQVLAQQLSERL